MPDACPRAGALIPFSSQRGAGQELATHLLNAYDNELAEVAHVRGAVAGDLHGAFKEWEVQAATLTRCREYLYSLSINPDPAQGPLTRDQYMDYIGRTEQALGLSNQPRAVVFHIKDGREHCHVVWSRIDADRQKAVHLAFDHEKLMRVTRSFTRDHGLALPGGYEKSRQVGQDSLYDREQARQTGLTKADHMRQVTEAWTHSDTAKTFVRALGDRGYVLATGRRDYVVMDAYGGMHSLPKLIDDKTVRTKDIRAFLGKDYPLEALPSVEEAEALVADHRRQTERALSEDRYAAPLAVLKHQQLERRGGLDAERRNLGERQYQERVTQQRGHRGERDALRHAHQQTVKNIRAMRDRNRPTGLAAFLGRVSGVALVRKAIHRYDDAKRLAAYRVERAQLRDRQAKDAKGLDMRLKLQAEEVDRKQAALGKVEKRELIAFLRDQRAEQRVRDRDEDGAMPLLGGPPVPGREREAEPPDLLVAFARANSEQPQSELPDLLAAFGRAANAREEEKSGDGSDRGLDAARPPDAPDDRGRDRGR